jgi:TonB family protein
MRVKRDFGTRHGRVAVSDTTKLIIYSGACMKMNRRLRRESMISVALNGARSLTMAMLIASCSLQQSSSASSASPQQATAGEKTWSITQNEDKLTDRTMLTATATAHAGENAAHIYQLTVKCDGEPREFALSTWSTSGGFLSKMNGRPMAWQTRVVQSGGQVTSRNSITNAPLAYAPIVESEVADPIRFRYRIDNATASSSILTRVSENVADLHPVDVFIPPPPPMDSGGALSSDQERALARLAAVTRGDSLTMTLPKTRLLFADVFPGETVEFSFSALRPEERSALQKMCQFDQAIDTAGSSTVTPTAARMGTSDTKPAAAPPLVAEPVPVFSVEWLGERRCCDAAVSGFSSVLNVTASTGKPTADIVVNGDGGCKASVGGSLDIDDTHAHLVPPLFIDVGKDRIQANNACEIDFELASDGAIRVAEKSCSSYHRDACPLSGDYRKRIDAPVTADAAAGASAVPAPPPTPLDGASGGSGDHFGSGAYRPGNGCVNPTLVRQVDPKYNSDAMHAKIQGDVEVEAVIQKNGTVGEARITRSLDTQFGLDGEAMKAVKGWRFRPATCHGQTVDMIVTLQLQFRLH